MVQKLIHRRSTAVFVLLALLVLSAVVSAFSHLSVRQAMQARFVAQSNEVARSLDYRLQFHELTLRSAAGLFLASTEVDRVEWREFVNGLDLPRHLPESLGLGYLELKRSPAGAQLKVLEPADPRFFELDWMAISGVPLLEFLKAGHDRVRLIRTGLPDTDEHSELAREYWLALAVHDAGGRVAGLVFERISMSRILDAMIREDHPDLDVTLLDPGALASRYGSVNGMPGSFERRIELSGALTGWVIDVSTNNDFWADAGLGMPWAILLIGLIISFLVFAVLYMAAQKHQELESTSDVLRHRLSQTESMLMSAIDAIGEPFVVYDENDRLAFCNEQYRDVYRTSAAVIQPGKTFEEIIRYGAERGQYQAAIGRVEEWVAERMAIHRSGNTDLIQQIAGGRILKILERKTPAGHIVGFRVDVTELYRAKEAAEAANRAKSSFLAMMSHEIRTPMNGMLGMAQVLLAQEVSTAERLDAARTILRSGQTLLSLLNDILDLSKIEAGQFKLAEGVFSPADVVNDCLSIFAEPARRKGLVLRAEPVPAADTRYLADQNRIHQMLSNLIGNAIKFTDHGEVSIAVAIHDEADQPERCTLEFAVIDTGIGISAEMLEQLFQPFQQLDASVSRQYGGTGLGLSIVRHLARLMGGDAGVTSAPGEGSRFWFRVQLGRITRPLASHEEPTARHPAVFDMPQYLGRVLIVEDDLFGRKVVESALLKMGLSLLSVSNGEKACKLVLGGETFDLILMDLNMPLMDGYEANRRIRAWELANGLKPTPVLAISADAYEQTRQRCLAEGMVGFVEKPVDFRTLTAELARWLPLREAAAVAPPEEAPALDEAALQSSLRKLLPLLEQHKFDALALFKEIRQMTAGSALAQIFERIGEHLDGLQFDKAAAAIRALAEEKSWRLDS